MKRTIPPCPLPRLVRHSPRHTTASPASSSTSSSCNALSREGLSSSGGRQKTSIPFAGFRVVRATITYAFPADPKGLDILSAGDRNFPTPNNLGRGSWWRSLKLAAWVWFSHQWRYVLGGFPELTVWTCCAMSAAIELGLNSVYVSDSATA